MGIGVLQKLGDSVGTLTKATVNGIIDAMLGHWLPRNEDGTLANGSMDLGARNNRWGVVYCQQINTAQGIGGDGGVNAPYGGVREFGSAGIGLRAYYKGAPVEVALLTQGQFRWASSFTPIATILTLAPANFADAINIPRITHYFIPVSGERITSSRAGAGSDFVDLSPFYSGGTKYYRRDSVATNGVRFYGFTDPDRVSINGANAVLTAGDINPVILQFPDGEVRLTAPLTAALPAYNAANTDFVFVTAERQLSIISQPAATNGGIPCVRRSTEYPANPANGLVVLAMHNKRWEQWNNAESEWQEFNAVLMAYRTGAADNMTNVISYEAQLAINRHQHAPAAVRVGDSTGFNQLVQPPLS